MAKGIRDYGQQHLTKVMKGTHDDGDYAKGAAAIKAAGKGGGPSRGALQDFQGGEAQGMSDAMRPARPAKL